MAACLFSSVSEKTETKGKADGWRYPSLREEWRKVEISTMRAEKLPVDLNPSAFPDYHRKGKQKWAGMQSGLFVLS